MFLLRKRKKWWEYLHIDLPLVLGLLCLVLFGFVVLYSASNESIALVERQAMNILIAVGVMLVFAQIPPHHYERWAPVLYLLGVILLLAVMAIGHTGKGAQRWLGVGALKFQPSEIMKIAIPMTLSLVLAKTKLPPSSKMLVICGLLLVVPVALTAKQPDLGTAIVLALTGCFVLFLTGLSWRFMMITLIAVIILMPMLWYGMHDYQRLRILTFLNPERDSLGAGYHIIQSKIAIGSGGLFGKGWLHGPQSQLDFLPEHTTDFIFAVCAEELGFVGILLLLSIYFVIIARGFYITLHAQDTFSRLLAGSITLMFFLSIFINIGMVIGILPVVGVPLPLVSYGGTSVVAIFISFGILMSIQTHRKLVES